MEQFAQSDRRTPLPADGPAVSSSQALTSGASPMLIRYAASSGARLSCASFRQQSTCPRSFGATAGLAVSAQGAGCQGWLWVVCGCDFRPWSRFFFGVGHQDARCKRLARCRAAGEAEHPHGAAGGSYADSQVVGHGAPGEADASEFCHLLGVHVAARAVGRKVFGESTVDFTSDAPGLPVPDIRRTPRSQACLQVPGSHAGGRAGCQLVAKIPGSPPLGKQLGRAVRGFRRR